MAILKTGKKNTSFAVIGPDGLTTDQRGKVPTTEIIDRRPVEGPPSGRPSYTVMGERGTVTIPVEVRRRHRLRAGMPILIDDASGNIVIKPAEMRPLQAAQHEDLDGLLDRVTPENTHQDYETGPAIGREAW